MAKIYISCQTTFYSREAADCAHIVRIGEETNTGYNTSSNVVPSERSFIDLSKSETTTLIGILDVSEVIMEVVEGIISTRRLHDVSSHCEKSVLFKDSTRTMELVDDELSRECRIG